MPDRLFFMARSNFTFLKLKTYQKKSNICRYSQVMIKGISADVFMKGLPDNLIKKDINEQLK